MRFSLFDSIIFRPHDHKTFSPHFFFLLVLSIFIFIHFFVVRESWRPPRTPESGEVGVGYIIEKWRENKAPLRRTDVFFSRKMECEGPREGRSPSSGSVVVDKVAAAAAAAQEPRQQRLLCWENFTPLSLCVRAACVSLAYRFQKHIFLVFRLFVFAFIFTSLKTKHSRVRGFLYFCVKI